MNLQHCEKETLVIEAARRGYWEEELRAHLVECSECADTASAGQFLREMQEIDLAEVKVPSAGWMWWRAQLMAKRAAAERATEPITLVEQIAGACGVLSVVGIFIWQWHAIRAFFSALGGTWQSGSYAAYTLVASRVQESSLLVLVSAGALVVVLGFAAYLIWAEE
jgi:hypothetical protein